MGNSLNLMAPNISQLIMIFTVSTLRSVDLNFSVDFLVILEILAT